ncbi:hypothetical protein MMC22_001054 [Lobaria immixta]|nr:hypothetical protein [Lobaria immixta]
MNSQLVNNDEAGGEFENESETKAGRRAAGAVEAEIGAGNGDEERRRRGGRQQDDSSRGFSGVARLANIMTSNSHNFDTIPHPSLLHLIKADKGLIASTYFSTSEVKTFDDR